MSAVAEFVTGQEELLALEQDFCAQYQAATQAETKALKASLTATVENHRLGVLANRLQPLVKEGTWGDYLKRHGMAIRTVQRAQRIARCFTEEAVANMTVTEADDLAAAKEAVERGNVSSVDEWREIKAKVAELREALDKQESERETVLAKFEEELEEKAQDEYTERAKKLDADASKALQSVEADAKAKAKENAAALTAAEMADALAAEGVKASIPAPRGNTAPLVPELAAALEPSETDAAEDAEQAGDELLGKQQMVALFARLRQIVAERPNDLTDAVEDPSIQEALDQLVDACSGDPEIVFAVVSVWAANNVL
ncbi:MAG: hypothetical protein GXY83_34190 [Rhodopirellula sp.]|nr:hypothetical protein [Rhodopirellula sp.]